jgi:hypothetical protein
MSTRYPGGIITKTPVVPAGPYESGTAPGIWTLEQQLQAQKAGIWPTAGLQPNYIEDVFSTYLYTGTGATQTITNGIDLSGKGGLTWIKQRSGIQNHTIFDTLRGANNYIRSDSTGAQNPGGTYTDLLTAFNSNGFTLGADASTAGFVNGSGSTYASWTFREQPKFFDVVTYTGTGANRTIAHNLGSVPGMIIVKRTDAVAPWQCYHRGLANTQVLVLNTTAAAVVDFQVWNSTTPTSSVFSLGTDTDVNASGGTYVAYLFAHDAGGFGLTGTDNVISCGSFTTDGSGNATVSLGYEPQWVLIKQTDGVDSWYLNDNMRGMAVSGNQPNLSPNLSAAESAGGYNTYPNATGFTASVGIASKVYIYIAIRRGPMKVATDATKVFSPVTRTGTNANATVSGSLDVCDAAIIRNRSNGGTENMFVPRLTGTGYLETSTTVAEVAAGATILQANPWDTMAGIKVGTTSQRTNANGQTFVNYLFRRAPGFFDVVCYTGTGSTNLQTHNLGVTPELLIIRSRSLSGTFSGYWQVLSKVGSNYRSVYLNTTGGATGDYAISSIATSTTLNIDYVGTNIITAVNSAGATCIAYLFATVAGVSKVGSYTGNGPGTQQINCGFTAGARFVMIKRADSSGSVGPWYVWDTARGIIAGNDPYFLLNSSASDVTNTDYIDPYSAGFELSSTAPNNLNEFGGTYIFLAIA